MARPCKIKLIYIYIKKNIFQGPAINVNNLLMARPCKILLYIYIKKKIFDKALPLMLTYIYTYIHTFTTHGTALLNNLTETLLNSNIICLSV